MESIAIQSAIFDLLFLHFKGCICSSRSLWILTSDIQTLAPRACATHTHTHTHHHQSTNTLKLLVRLNSTLQTWAAITPISRIHFNWMWSPAPRIMTPFPSESTVASNYWWGQGLVEAGCKSSNDRDQGEFMTLTHPAVSTYGLWDKQTIILDMYHQPWKYWNQCSKMGGGGGGGKREVSF